MTLEEKARRLLELHQRPPMLLLANAWDAATAKVIELAGFPAIATTSAGIANALGYPDRERVSRDEMLDIVARIARAVAVPVTADVEAGYGDLLATARAVVAAGAVGMNVEDSIGEAVTTLVDVEEQCATLRAIRALNLPLVVNARTDIFLFEIGDPSTRLARTIERLNAFREAGADCLFAPGVRDLATVTTLVREVRGPLNILALPGGPSLAEMQSAGVARVSIGSGVARAALAFVRRIAVELRDGSYASLFADQIPYVEINRMLE